MNSANSFFFSAQFIDIPDRKMSNKHTHQTAKTDLFTVHKINKQSTMPHITRSRVTFTRAQSRLARTNSKLIKASKKTSTRTSSRSTKTAKGAIRKAKKTNTVKKSAPKAEKKTKPKTETTTIEVIASFDNYGQDIWRMPIQWPPQSPQHLLNTLFASLPHTSAANLAEKLASLVKFSTCVLSSDITLPKWHIAGIGYSGKYWFNDWHNTDDGTRQCRKWLDDFLAQQNRN